MSPLGVLIMTALACSVVGVFLVLRNSAMVSDAISHTVLLGIILGYLLTKDMDSPMLMIGAALFGVLTVYAIELLVQKFNLKSDSATGLIFPLFFSLAVILISKYARNVHLCVDTVIMGEVIFTPLNTMNFLGMELPKAFVQMSIVFVVNLLFVTIFYKELKISTFDPEYAAVAGLSVVGLHYALMTLVSITTVTAFEAVGSILVISFLVAPALSAYLLSKRLYVMMGLAMGYGVVNCLLGYVLAFQFNVSMTGMCATVALGTFFITLLLYPEGVLRKALHRRKMQRKYQESLILTILPDSSSVAMSSEVLLQSFHWSQSKSEKMLRDLMKTNLITSGVSGYTLTEKGSQERKEVYQRYQLDTRDI